MKHIIRSILLLLSVTACSPKVVTDMFTQEYAPISPDSVRLFMLHQPVPPQTLAIGEVKVVDNGFSVHGSYERVLQMAIDATAQNGGNGLIVTKHRAPDMISTIHRVWGTMLRIPQSVADTLHLTSMSRVMELSEYDEFLQYKAAKRQMEEQRRSMEEVRRNAPCNIIRISAGPSWLTSKYQIGNHVYRSKMGFSFLADYDHVWKSGIGFGINYLYNHTSFDEGVTMRLNYIGPSLVLAFAGNKMRYDMSLGFGYCCYRESLVGSSYSEGKVAALMRLGLERKIGEHLALGLQMNMFSMRMNEPDDIQLKKNEFYGIQSIGLQAGLRYYF